MHQTDENWSIHHSGLRCGHKFPNCHLYICKCTAEHVDMLSIFTGVPVSGPTCAQPERLHWSPRGSRACKPSHAWLKCGSKAVGGKRGARDMRGGESHISFGVCPLLPFLYSEPLIPGQTLPTSSAGEAFLMKL